LIQPRDGSDKTKECERENDRERLQYHGPFYEHKIE